MHRSAHLTACCLALCLSPAARAAGALTSPDGKARLDAPDSWTVTDDQRLRRGRDALSVQLLDTVTTGGLAPADFLHGLASRESAGMVTYTWSGRTETDRPAGCIDTRKATSNLKPELRTWCAVELVDGKVAVFVMQTTDVLNARTHGSRARKLVDHLSWTGAGAEATATAPTATATATAATAAATPAATTAPTTAAATTTSTNPRIAGLDDTKNYRCFTGRWNTAQPDDDLRIYWRRESKEMVARFTVLDGTAPQTYYLAGTLDVTDTEFFGHLDKFEGPMTSLSGIHRFFGGLDAQGTVTSEGVTEFRTTQDQAFTRLVPCPD